MTNEIVAFRLDTRQIRTALDSTGELWFMAKDVAECLGYSQTSGALKHARNARSIDEFNTANGLFPATKWVTEADLYRMIMGSTSHKAKIARDEMVSQVRDVKHILKAIQDFEIPDDLPDMFVYAIREKDTGNVKLGISRDPRARLGQLQTGNSHELELIAVRKAENRFKDEKALHIAAKAYHLHGEWFDHRAVGAMR